MYQINKKYMTMITGAAAPSSEPAPSPAAGDGYTGLAGVLLFTTSYPKNLGEWRCLHDVALGAVFGLCAGGQAGVGPAMIGAVVGAVVGSDSCREMTPYQRKHLLDVG